MTSAEFERIRSRLGRLTLDTVQIARRVLVEGIPQKDVAEDAGLTKQRVSSMVNRVLAAARAIPPEWVRVEEWFPPDLAAKVRKMAADAKASIQQEK
ncbi:MAG: TrfB-related DNA-binding protein [Burkholderia gladioli]